jgi:mRNA-degrading endonuclease toxin of MazEF toxin-antitoxin module
MAILEILGMIRGSVWWVDFEPAKGGEIQKVRPAVIISNDTADNFLNRVIYCTSIYKQRNKNISRKCNCTHSRKRS